jgi:hypothetical protein
MVYLWYYIRFHNSDVLKTLTASSDQRRPNRQAISGRQQPPRNAAAVPCSSEIDLAEMIRACRFSRIFRALDAASGDDCATGTPHYKRDRST